MPAPRNKLGIDTEEGYVYVYAVKLEPCGSEEIIVITENIAKGK